MKEVYASVYQLISIILAFISVLSIIILSKAPIEFTIIIISFLSYKGKIPLYRIKK